MSNKAKKRYNFRFDEGFVQKIDDWARLREDITGLSTSRTEAIRLLISKGLQLRQSRAKKAG